MILDEFTKEEIERINVLYGTDFKDIKPNDALLIGRFEAAKAKDDEEFKARMQAISDESKATVKSYEAQKKQALANLKELHDAALARLEQFDNGI